MPLAGSPAILGDMETTPAIQDYLGAIYDLAGGEKPVIGARLARYMHLSAPSITDGFGLPVLPPSIGASSGIGIGPGSLSSE